MLGGVVITEPWLCGGMADNGALSLHFYYDMKKEKGELLGSIPSFPILTYKRDTSWHLKRDV